jgi:hypothetical protein
MISIEVASGVDLSWSRDQVERHHYLGKAPDPRSRPLAYVVRLDARPVGCLWFGRPESTRCYAGELTYGSLQDVTDGRARWDRWEVLCLSRVWLSPDVQTGGELCRPEIVPGFTDRRGVWRPAVASTVIRKALGRVGFDYLTVHPPVFPEQPYQIRVVMSYANTRLHSGTIYPASGFRLSRPVPGGVETWFTDKVATLTDDQDAAILEASRVSRRCRRIRARSEQPSLF